jgi:3-mercaptopyruvate sulfurtransferase SseA
MQRPRGAFAPETSPPALAAGARVLRLGRRNPQFVTIRWLRARPRGYLAECAARPLLPRRAGSIAAPATRATRVEGDMAKGWVHWFLAVVIGGLVVAQPADAADGGKGNLVSVAWLEANLKRDDVLLLDASPAQLHKAKHIPGAVNVDLFSFGGREISAAEMERRIRSWGVSEGKKVVIYDQGGTYLATSLFFDLYYYGYPAEDLRVLDGGLARWQATGGAVTAESTPAPNLGTFRVAKQNEDVRVRLPEFLVASGDPANYALVEALDPSYHFGGAKFFDRAGHVPNAIMMPATDFYNADKTFKSAEEIRRMLVYLGVRPDQQVLTHCGGGIAASVPFFAMKFMLDYPKVRLYKESQLEWLRDDRGLPFWTYDAPNLMREKSWLNGWGGPMTRTFGVSRLSVVDVRPAASFKRAHVPFAINVPADVFRRHLASPAKLAGILGAAGVDASYEAVIVSEGGLNADSALAFLLLERLGQKRVSIFTDSVDDWAFAGFPLVKETDAADPGKASPGPFNAPTTYPVNLRPGIVIGDSQGTREPYPKVYLASGKSLPAKVPDGKVIHLPYTELLTANGAPRAATDIWNALVKAGVPRYAEIVSFSEDPGEAAANYFVLKLMGYPDVKVLVM